MGMEIQLQRENSQSMEIRSQFGSSSQPVVAGREAQTKQQRANIEEGGGEPSQGTGWEAGGGEGGYVMRQIWKAQNLLTSISSEEKATLPARGWDPGRSVLGTATQQPVVRAYLYVDFLPRQVHVRKGGPDKLVSQISNYSSLCPQITHPKLSLTSQFRGQGKVAFD